MNRLENFPGFTVTRRQKQQVQFNPFEGEEGTRQTRRSEEPSVRSVPEKFINVLGSTDTASSNPAHPGDSMLELFPKPVVAVAPIPPTPVEEEIPMIQPRSTDGQRLLYKHPHLPKVGAKGAYWLLVGTEDRSKAAWLVQFDGAANPNPGPASSGAVLWSPIDLDGKRSVVFESGKYLGKATNNIAEAQGLLLGLQIAAARGAREILIEGDSELIIFQNTRKYKVSDKNLKVWWSTAQAAMMDEASFDWIAIRQVPREQNERADSITKEVLVRKQNFVR
jgi:ribonuclease HI